MATEFKATHRYNGKDNGMVFFSAGEEVMFVRASTPLELGNISDENGVYANAEGLEQYVEYVCVEAL